MDIKDTINSIERLVDAIFGDKREIFNELKGFSMRHIMNSKKLIFEKLPKKSNRNLFEKVLKLLPPNQEESFRKYLARVIVTASKAKEAKKQK